MSLRETYAELLHAIGKSVDGECSKCGWRVIVGPAYEYGYNAGYLGERLRYRCARCGYSWATPCKDAEAKR